MGMVPILMDDEKPGVSMKRLLNETDMGDDDDSSSSLHANKKYRKEPDYQSNTAPNLAKFYQNMDSFCTICKKEVCNKYFLRTHLANKHGIFITDDLTATSYLSTLEQHVAATSQFATIDDSDVKTTNQIESTQNDYLEQRVNDDYCELCQKQFCNKYYLRKHKADVHGVHIDPASAQATQQTNGSSRSKKTLEVNTSVKSGLSSSSTPSPQNTSLSGSSILNGNQIMSQQANASNLSLMDSLQSSSKIRF
jgi:hypothetical protein